MTRRSRHFSISAWFVFGALVSSATRPADAGTSAVSVSLLGASTDAGGGGGGGGPAVAVTLVSAVESNGTAAAYEGVSVTILLRWYVSQPLMGAGGFSSSSDAAATGAPGPLAYALAAVGEPVVTSGDATCLELNATAPGVVPEGAGFACEYADCATILSSAAPSQLRAAAASSAARWTPYLVSLVCTPGTQSAEIVTMNVPYALERNASLVTAQDPAPYVAMRFYAPALAAVGQQQLVVQLVSSQARCSAGIRANTSHAHNASLWFPLSSNLTKSETERRGARARARRRPPSQTPDASAGSVPFGELTSVTVSLADETARPMWYLRPLALIAVARWAEAGAGTTSSNATADTTDASLANAGPLVPPGWCGLSSPLAFAAASLIAGPIPPTAAAALPPDVAAAAGALLLNQPGLFEPASAVSAGWAPDGSSVQVNLTNGLRAGIGGALVAVCALVEARPGAAAPMAAGGYFPLYPKAPPNSMNFTEVVVGGWRYVQALDAPTVCVASPACAAAAVAAAGGGGGAQASSSSRRRLHADVSSLVRMSSFEHAVAWDPPSPARGASVAALAVGVFASLACIVWGVAACTLAL